MSTSALLPDPETSWAVLVSVSTYRDPDLPDMPEALASMERLADALTPPTGLLDPSRIIRLADPQSAGEVLVALARAAESAAGALFFCYLGHGETDGHGGLYFCLPGTEPGPQVSRTALSAESVLRILHDAAAPHRVALLDCCFSGLALDAPGGGDVHLLTAADRSRKALISADRGLTCFSGELLGLLEDGVPDGPEYLDLAELYRRLSVALGKVPDGAPRGSRPPNPLQRTVGSSGDLALARNPAHGTGLTREGLRARARHAYGVSDVRHAKQPWRVEQAVALMDRVVADATSTLGPTDRDTLRLRHAHASVVYTARGRDSAVALLRDVVTDMAEVLPADDPILAEAADSLNLWRHS